MSRSWSSGPLGGRRRSVALGVALGLALLLAFTAFVTTLAEDAVRSEAEARVGAIATGTAQLVAEQDLRLEEVTTAYAQRLAGVPAPVRARLPAADAARVRDTLRELRTGLEGVNSAVLTDPLGRVVAVDPPTDLRPGRDLSGRDWVRGIRRAEEPTYRSRAFVTDAPRVRRTTVAAVRVRGAGGRVIGFLGVADGGRTQALVDRAGIRGVAMLTVLDQAGTVVARTGPTPPRLVSRAREAGVQAGLRGRTGVRVEDVAGRPTVAGHAPVDGPGWVVLAELPADDAFADVTRLRATLLAGAAVVAFLLLWLVPLLVLRLGSAQERVSASERFQTDLLPSDLPPGVVTLYVPGERRMLLGGDFLDAVRTPDGGLAVLVGDVCGHGPRAAALAARLRAAWRTLATAGASVERLDLLDQIVVSERPDPDLFVTVICAHVSEDGSRLRYVLAGHPPGLIDQLGLIDELGREARGPALGLGADVDWPVAELGLEEDWTLVLYTDGLVEAPGLHGGERLEVLGLQALLGTVRGPAGVDPDRLVRAVADFAARGLDDDLALLVVSGAGLRGVAGAADVAR